MLRDNQSLEDRKCLVGVDASEENPAGKVELDGVELVLAGGVFVDLGSLNIREMVKDLLLHFAAPGISMLVPSALDAHESLLILKTLR
ncbi:hypothetical protein HG530_005993 [Fusarium avenaceum]|nr:hypothetical protein HG530_005993 [Fusarium avenaceum]